VKPDVVICDLGLPDLDGYEVGRTLRADESLRSTRLIALSGYAQPEDIERAREAGFEAHLPKPAPLERLVVIDGQRVKEIHAAPPPSAGTRRCAVDPV
jgi:CheY-like chemotaxis protein